MNEELIPIGDLGNLPAGTRVSLTYSGEEKTATIRRDDRVAHRGFETYVDFDEPTKGGASSVRSVSPGFAEQFNVRIQMPVMAAVEPFATKAKFAVWSRTETQWGTDVTLQPVTGGSVENESFFKATPQGELRLGGLTAEVAAGLTPGKTFYVELTEAE